MTETAQTPAPRARRARKAKPRLLQRLRAAPAAAAKALGGLVGAWVSPSAVQIQFALAGIGLIVAGVAVQFGLGFGLISGGVACLLVVRWIARGLTSDG